MNLSLQRRLTVLLASAAVALGVWKWTPGSAIDETAFTTVVHSFANPPLFISGHGSHADPWSLRLFSNDARPDQRQAPVIVSLGDDLDSFFQSNPPAPIDLAVVLNNFHRLGAKKAACAVVLAWDAPDSIGLTALESSLASFDALVMAAPLSRGAVPSSMPPAFRRASLPLSAVTGNSAALPVVNRVPIPGIILAGEKTLAGFSMIESEPASRHTPLLARWEDRLVFSFPLLTILQRLNISTSQLEIHLGEFLKLGPTGPLLPIDDFGRLDVPLRQIPALAEISAESVIDGGDDLFPKQAPDPVILRDDRSTAEPTTRAFSRSLSAAVAVIASNEELAPLQLFPRLTARTEILSLAVLVVLLFLVTRLTDFPRRLCFLILAATCLASPWLGLGLANHWLPALPSLAAIFIAAALTEWFAWKNHSPVSPSSSL